MRPHGPHHESARGTYDFGGSDAARRVVAVENWLAGGHFPGAFKNADGHWRFPRHDVEAVNGRVEELRGRNARGEVVPDDLGDMTPAPPVL